MAWIQTDAELRAGYKRDLRRWRDELVAIPEEPAYEHIRENIRTFIAALEAQIAELGAARS